MKLNVVQMNHIGFKVVKHHADLASGIGVVNDAQRRSQIGLDACFKIPRSGIGLYAVANGVALVGNAEVLHFVAVVLKDLSKLDDVSFRPALGVEKLIDKQYFHSLILCAYTAPSSLRRHHPSCTCC